MNRDVGIGCNKRIVDIGICGADRLSGSACEVVKVRSGLFGSSEYSLIELKRKSAGKSCYERIVKTAHISRKLVGEGDDHRKLVSLHNLFGESGV